LLKQKGIKRNQSLITDLVYSIISYPEKLRYSPLFIFYNTFYAKKVALFMYYLVKTKIYKNEWKVIKLYLSKINANSISLSTMALTLEIYFSKINKISLASLSLRQMHLKNHKFPFLLEIYF
jgi:hypothetical protein